MCSNNCVGIVELDYVVLKLNGSDVTSLSSYEAVQMFLQDKETLVVEICRKKNSMERPLKTNDDIVPIDSEQEAAICAQEDNCKISNDRTACTSPNVMVNSNSLTYPSPLPTTTTKNPIILTLRTFSNNVPDDVEPFAVSKGTQTMDNFFDLKNAHGGSDHNEDIVQTIADHFIEQEHHLFEQCLEPEIDIEEVTLVKMFSDQIGLSVCSNGFFNNSNNDDIAEPGICIGNSNSNLDIISSDDANEDVFISDIQPASIAERDGRLRRGDQILRINGKDIKSKKHAETQMAESNISVTLLVSRILYPEDDDDDDDDIDSNFEYANSFLTDDYTNVVDKLDKVLLAQRQFVSPVNDLINGTEPAVTPINIKIPTPSGYPQANANTEMKEIKGETQANSNGASTEKEKTTCENSSISSYHSKLQLNGNSSQEVALKQLIVKNLPNTTKTKSVAIATAISKQYDYDDSEHIYETIPEDSESEPLYCSPYQSSNYMTAMGSCSSADVLEMQQQTQRVAQWLGIKSEISPRSVHTLAGRPSLFNRQQHRISNRVYTLRSAITNTNQSGSSSSGVGYSACRHNTVDNETRNQNINLQEVENSSSAYNTGGSNNSASPRQNALNPGTENITTAATNQQSTIPNYHSASKSASQSAKDTFSTNPISSMLMLPFAKTGRILFTETQNQNKTNTEELHPFTSASAKNDSKSMRPKPTEEQQSQCPQFNAPNLSRYHFVSSQEVANKTVTVPKPSSIFVTTESVSEEIPMVWKVKRRPDGTRYIVKRPVRNHVHMGIRKNIRNTEKTTTEDDTISEVKIGRYWTKEERKRHIERARERRHHQQLPHQQQFPTE